MIDLKATYWKGRSHDLGRMSLAKLTQIFFTYPAVLVYLVLAAASFAFAFAGGAGWVRLTAAAVAATFVYPLVWYALHRFVLHGRYLYKNSKTAAVWKRIHFDHHQDPHDLRVLFGALHTTLPTVAVVTIPIGLLIGGWGAAAMALGVALVTTALYEFVHCVQHLNHLPDWRFLQRLKQLHLAHHFHSEKGNYGIIDFFWDRAFGTYYDNAKEAPRSATVFNLGYTEEEAQKYPWVKELSGGERRDDGPRARARAAVRADVAAKSSRGESINTDAAA